MHTTRGSVYRDIGFSEQESRDLELRGFLAVKISQFIRNNNLTQQKAADFFGIHRPKISDIMRGELAGISADYMMKLLLMTGGKLDVKFRQPTMAKARKLIKDSMAA
jgi:predicted XRE-type DNA-binding protein